METEIWKYIPGYEGHYQVSSLGRVRSIKKGKEYFMKPRTHTSIRDGKRTIRYIIIDLRKPGAKKIKMFMHVLMARMFIPNPLNLPIVDHKDRDTFNYKLSNLEWVTPEENCRRWRSLKKESQLAMDNKTF